MARKVPINYLMLLVFTVCETYSVAATSIYYAATSPGTTLQAFAGTALITLACTLYAFTTRKDFTMKGGLMFILAFSLLFLVLIMLPIFRIEGNNFGYDAIITIIVMILGIYIIIDTQMIVGKGRWSLSMDDYIIGAMLLYVDIITVFLYLLALFGKK